jgi:hypothetical protein
MTGFPNKPTPLTTALLYGIAGAAGLAGGRDEFTVRVREPWEPKPFYAYGKRATRPYARIDKAKRKAKLRMAGASRKRNRK